MPVDIGNFHHTIHNLDQLAIYEPDNEAKINYYAQKLSQADYIVINSSRLYGTLIHLPEKHPLTSRYYELLFFGSLGYQKIAQFTSYPSLFGIEINDDSTEETFQVYEHPKVLIFQNSQFLSAAELTEILRQ